MKTLAIALLLSATCLGATAADAPQAWRSVPLRNAKSPDAGGAISTAIQAAAASSAAGVATTTTSATASAAPAAALPAIAAAGEAAPTASVPAKATAEQLPAGLQPGQPAKTYPTLEAAAKDGINPMRSISAPTKPAAASQAFDPLDLQAYISMLRAYLGPNGPTIALGGLLAVLLGVAFLLRRAR